MAHPLFIVDAFATGPFQGNAAAVVLLDEDMAYPGDDYLLAVAREMNLSETAFLSPQETLGHYELRWFTPVREVDLCGHATLASAQVLYDNGKIDLHTPIVFHTRSGELEARPFVDSGGSFAEGHKGGVGVKIYLPSDPMKEAPLPDGLVDALGLDAGEIVFTGRGSAREYDWFVEVTSADVVRNLSPHFDHVEKLTTDDDNGIARGVAVATVDGEQIYSRCFYPAYGIDEDPVTGSAHCMIGPYFSSKLEREQLHCHQGLKRQGELLVTPRGNVVELAGRAITVVRGELTVEAL